MSTSVLLYVLFKEFPKCYDKIEKNVYKVFFIITPQKASSIWRCFLFWQKRYVWREEKKEQYIVLCANVKRSRFMWGVEWLQKANAVSAINWWFTVRDMEFS